MRAHPRRRRSQPACGGDQVTGIGCDSGESSSGTEDALQVIPATHGARYQCAITSANVGTEFMRAQVTGSYCLVSSTYVL